MIEQTYGRFQNGKEREAHNGDTMAQFALATRKGREESGRVAEKAVTWFMFGNEEGKEWILHWKSDAAVQMEKIR